MKKIVVLMLILVLMLGGGWAVLFNSRLSLVESKIQSGLQTIMGLPVELEGLAISDEGGLFPFGKMQVHMERLKIKNGPGFEGEYFAVVEPIDFKLKDFQWLFGRWHLAHLAASISQTYFERNALGAYNYGALPALKKELFENSNRSLPDFEIENLEIRLGLLSYAQQGSQGLGESETFDLAEKIEAYANVRDPYIVIQAPILKMVYSMNKGSMGIPRGKIQENMARHSGAQSPPQS